MTSIWRPRRQSHMLKNNFITWYYPLWMVEVIVNMFKGIICSFSVNNGSNLWRYWNQMFALFPAAIFVLLRGAQIWHPHSEPYKISVTFWRATQKWKTVQAWDLVWLLIYRYSEIWNCWLQTFHGFDFSFRLHYSENHQQSITLVLCAKHIDHFLWRCKHACVIKSAEKIAWVLRRIETPH